MTVATFQMAQAEAAGWTKERVDQLKKLLGEGKSASEMGRTLGVTRNAVIGKVIRMGLSLAGGKHAAPTVRPMHAPSVKRDPYGQNGLNFQTSAKTRLKAHTLPLSQNIDSPAPKHAGINGWDFRRADGASGIPVSSPKVRDLPHEEPGAATILTVGPRMCKWPIGDPASPDFTICGGKQERGSYCIAHGKIAFQTVNAKARG